MLGIELVADKASKTPFDVAVKSAECVFKHCLDLGVVVRPIGNLVVISPPLTLTKEHCDKIIAALNSAIGLFAEELNSIDK